MSERMGMFLFIGGLILTMFGVGGVEASATDAAMWDSCVVCAVGLGIMWCGVLGINNSYLYNKDSYDDLYPWQK